MKKNKEKKKRANELSIANEKRREANEYLENLLDYANAPIIVWDTQYEITRFNKAFENLTGRTEKDVIGKSLEILFPPVSKDSSMEHIKKTLEGTRWEVVEINILHIDGSVRTVLWNSANIMSQDGKTAVATIAQGQDITERKLAEEEIGKRVAELSIANEKRREANEYLENLLNYANAPIIVWDMQYEITRFNKAFENLTGRTENDVIGKSLEILFPPVSKDSSMEHIKKTLEGTRWEVVEINILHIDGSVRTVLWNSANIMSQDGKTAVATIAQGQDITERKLAEEEIGKRVAELIIANKEIILQYEEKAKLDSELLVAKKEIDIEHDEKEKQVEANKELEAFSYSVSHDLRAPLRHVIGFIDLLKKSNSTQLDEKGLRYLDIIAESALEMGNLIDALLTFSRLSRTDMELTPINSKQMVTQVLKTFNDELVDRNIEIIISELPDAMGDESLITQVWINLISNALKYSKNEEKVVIEIGGSIDNGKVIFFVKDNGVGFDMKYADKLFGVFQRLHKVKDFEGIGIGLANVGRIVTRHGGICWAESEVGKGATFFFNLKN